MLKVTLAASFVALSSASQASEAQKFVGVWEGNFDTPIYTKLVVNPDASLTYCEVSSCREVNCYDMAYSGSLDGDFTYEDAFGHYAFSRISEEEFEATFTHIMGDVSTAYYEPE